jgi:hypothetical protein
MSTPLDHANLKAKQRALRDDFPETMGLKVHRAISWTGRAEDCGSDHDAAFMFRWIAFNAAYAGEGVFQEWSHGERDVFRNYFKALVTLDVDNRIGNAIWQRFTGPIKALMINKYVFHPFWQHHNGVPGYESWSKSFLGATRKFGYVLKDGDTATVLCFVFDRLYVLRNQLIHGGATWNSDVNRAQVRDGAEILGFLVQVFVDIMMDHPGEDWGKPFYPVVA